MHESAIAKVLRINKRVVDIGKDLKLTCHPQVVSITGKTITDDLFSVYKAHLRIDKWLDHPLILP